MSKLTGNESAFPTSPENYINGNGLTLRQYYAGLAMQWLLSNIIVNNPNEKHKMITTENLAKSALSYADATIKALNDNEPQNL